MWRHGDTVGVIVLACVVMASAVLVSAPRCRPSDAAFEKFWSACITYHAKNLFARSRPSGRVEATGRGNTLQLATRGVSELTRLFSPDAF